MSLVVEPSLPVDLRNERKTSRSATLAHKSRERVDRPEYFSILSLRHCQNDECQETRQCWMWRPNFHFQLTQVLFTESS